MFVLPEYAGKMLHTICRLKLEDLYRSDVHFWQHGRIGDSMVVTDEVSFILIPLFENPFRLSEVWSGARICR